MFRRVLYENWHDLVPIVAFVLTFTVFLVAFIRAMLMRPDKAAAMSLLPLDVDIRTNVEMDEREVPQESSQSKGGNNRGSKIK